MIDIIREFMKNNKDAIDDLLIFLTPLCVMLVIYIVAAIVGNSIMDHDRGGVIEENRVQLSPVLIDES